MAYISKFNCVARIVGNSSGIPTKICWWFTRVSESIETLGTDVNIEGRLKLYDSQHQKTLLVVDGTRTQVFADWITISASGLLYVYMYILISTFVANEKINNLALVFGVVVTCDPHYKQQATTPHNKILIL